MDSKEEITEIIIHLSPEQAAFLDALAAEEGTSRSAIAQSIFNDKLEFLMAYKLKFASACEFA